MKIKKCNKLRKNERFFYPSSQKMYTCTTTKPTVEITCENGNSWKLANASWLEQEVIIWTKKCDKLIDEYYELQSMHEETTEREIERELASIQYKDWKHYTGYKRSEQKIAVPFKTNATPLDIQAQELSEKLGREVTEQDLIDYLQNYPQGYSRFVYNTVLQDFKEETGKPIAQFLKPPKPVSQGISDTPF